MKKALKHSLSLFLAITIIFSSAYVGLNEVDFGSVFAVKAKAATVTSGATYDCTWTLDGTVLTISGNGEMDNYGDWVSLDDYMSWTINSPWGTNITKVIISDGVTNIGDYAFENCKSLTSVTIPNSIKNIGNGAFSGCTSLKSVTIPDSVTSIGDSAFYNCASLSSITIPDCVTDIASYAFQNTGYYDNSSNWQNDVLYIDNHLIKAKETLSGNYTIKNGTKTIASGAFNNCKSLAAVTFGNSVTNIGSSAFYNCTSLSSFTIPDSVTSIGSGAFENTAYYNNSSNWQNNVLYIGNHLIKAKETLSGNYIIKSGTKTIAASAFRNCNSLATITIPDSVIRICYFGGCTNLTSIIVDSNNEKYVSIDGVLFNKTKTKLIQYPIGKVKTSYVVPDSVTSIGGSAFYNCTRLTSVTIPDSVTTIGNYAFYNCTGLASVTIGNSVTRIGKEAFFGCTNLASVTISDSVTHIGDYAFYGCRNLGAVHISDIASWCNISFYRHYSNPLRYAKNLYLNGELVGNLIIPNSVTNICEYAFQNCTSIRTITIPDSVKSIGNGAFSGCTKMNAVYITDIVKWCSITFGSNPLSYAKKLYLNGELVTNLNVPDGITSIGNGIFNKCTSLTSITIPNSVRNIESGAFENCVNLTSITISDSVTNIGSGAFNNTGYYNDSSNWRYDVLYIGKHLIRAKTTLRGIYVVEDGTKTIADDAFLSCVNLVSITIPGSVISIGNGSFNDCINLREVNTPCNSYASKCFEKSLLKLTHGALSNWIIDSQATINAPGKKHKECTTCGEVIETATITQLKPSTPKVTTTNEIGGVNVTWNKVAGAVKYNVYRRQGGYSTWTLVGTTTGNTLLDKNVKSGVYYVYSVRAYNVSGGYSDFVSANTNTRKYMAVPQLTGISNATNGLYIKWNPVSGVTNGYRVYRRGAGSVHWYYLGTVKTNYFTDTTIKNNSGEYYRYTVIADGGYHSKFDTTGLYLKRLANPTLTSAVSSKSGITVKWGTVKTATDYYVYRKTANSGWVRIATLPGNSTTTYLDKTAKKGTTYTYTVRACSGSTISYFNSGISCYDKY